MTLSPYTGLTGRASWPVATADADVALASLAAIADAGVGLVLPGRGDPWRLGCGPAASAGARDEPSPERRPGILQARAGFVQQGCGQARWFA
ncbi:hypothetical protein QJS66_20305 [Kocuria rhizophila]|nr:hypothetical protein QJS66_20305 [Kocuria rhizophila]